MDNFSFIVDVYSYLIRDFNPYLFFLFLSVIMNKIAKWFTCYGNLAYRHHYTIILESLKTLKSYTVVIILLRKQILLVTVLCPFQNMKIILLYSKYYIIIYISIFKTCQYICSMLFPKAYIHNNKFAVQNKVQLTLHYQNWRKTSLQLFWYQTM